MDMVIGRPVVVRAVCRVRTDELVEDLERRYGRVKLASWTRMLGNTGVVERPWSAPLEETAARAGVGVRSRAAHESVRDRAVKSAGEALEQAGLGPQDVDVLVTTHTTSWTIPGLDVDLVGRLALRPHVERVAEDAWELVLPDSSRAYWSVVHEGGVSFDSGKEATTASQRVVPYLTEWLDGRPVEWAAVHPGGPGIISGTLTGLGLDAEAAGRHARDSLTGGNLGGVALQDVPARTMTDGAAGGGGGLWAGVHGPGFTAAALYLRAVRSGAAG